MKIFFYRDESEIALQRGVETVVVLFKTLS